MKDVTLNEIIEFNVISFYLYFKMSTISQMNKIKMKNEKWDANQCLKQIQIKKRVKILCKKEKLISKAYFFCYFCYIFF